MKNKRQHTLDYLRFFIPSNLQEDFSLDTLQNWRSELGLQSTTESTDGISPEQAFFEKTEHGKEPEKVTDLKELVRLLWAQRRLSLNQKMWRSDNVTPPTLEELQEEREEQQQPVTDKRSVGVWDWRTGPMPTETDFNNALFELWQQHKMVDKVIVTRGQFKKIFEQWMHPQIQIKVPPPDASDISEFTYQSDFQDVPFEIV